jgi:DNA mismatch endonuclease (patch repair protein)
MPDIFTPEKRSWVMSRIRSKNSIVEKMVFSDLRKKKIYFQRHYRKAVGCPDIALPRKKKAVFIDGDFWHGYQFLKIKNRLPKKYWIPKIEANIKRDKKQRSYLRRNGWKILRVWEHELKDERKRIEALFKISNFLKS